LGQTALAHQVLDSLAGQRPYLVSIARHCKPAR
jgi:hypothetical protein